VTRNYLDHSCSEFRISILPASVVHDLKALNAWQEWSRLGWLNAFRKELKHVVKVANVSLGQTQYQVKVALKQEVNQFEYKTLRRLLQLIHLERWHESLKAFNQQWESGLELILESLQHLHLLCVHDLIQAEV